MGTLYKSFLLFGMNWLDAQLTVLWVRLNVATEGNGVMASLLDQGVLPFILVKLTIGAFAAFILYRFAHLPLARRGMKLVLGVYAALMFVHLVTGFSALGWHGPETVLGYVFSLPHVLMTIIS
jgi:hypothetical protein